MSTGTSAWRPSWPTVRHLAAEFILILAGVLTALFVDTWWKGRDDRALERTYLMQLLEDTRDNQEILERTIAGYTASRTGTGRLLLAFRDPTQRISADSMARWARISVPAFDPITGTMRGLLETGQIRLVRNDAIRRAIVATDAEISSIEARVGRNDLRQGELVELRTQRMVANLPSGAHSIERDDGRGHQQRLVAVYSRGRLSSGSDGPCNLSDLVLRAGEYPDGAQAVAGAICHVASAARGGAWCCSDSQYSRMS